MAVRSRPFTLGARKTPPLDAQAFIQAWNRDDVPKNNDLRSSIVAKFQLNNLDDYVYYAGQASVTLPQAQVAIDHGDANGMHNWYQDENGEQVLQH